MMDKIYQKIERTNQSAVLGTQVTGAADWWLRETSDKIIQPLLAEFPDPDPVGVAERMVRIQAIQAEIEELKGHASVLPVSNGCAVRRSLTFEVTTSYAVDSPGRCYFCGPPGRCIPIGGDRGVEQFGHPVSSSDYQIRKEIAADLRFRNLR